MNVFFLCTVFILSNHLSVFVGHQVKMLCGLDDGGLADLTAALSLSAGSCGEALVLLAGT